MKNFNFFEKLWEHSRTLRRVGLVLVMCLITISQAWAWYVPGNLSGSMRDNVTANNMGGDNKITFFAVPAGTYKLQLTNGSNWSGNSCVKTVSGCTKGTDGTYATITISAAKNVTVEIEDAGNWKVKVTATDPCTYIKYGWGGGTWNWSQGMNPYGDGKYACVGQYSGGKDFSYQVSTDEEHYNDGKSNVTVDDGGVSLTTTDNCIFIYDVTESRENPKLTIKRCSQVGPTNYVYFDNTESNWSGSYVYFMIGRPVNISNPYLATYRMTAVGNTKLYRYIHTSGTWTDADYYAVGERTSSAYGSGNNGWTVVPANFQHWSAPYTSIYNMENTHYYMISKTSGDNNTAITIAEKGTAYSCLNSLTVGYKYNLNGSDMSSGTTPAQISMVTYSFSNCSTAVANTTQTISANTSGTYTKSQSSAAYRGAVTLTMSSLQSDYVFLGWYEGETRKSSDASYTYYPKANTTVIAKFAYKWNIKGSNAAMGSWSTYNGMTYVSTNTYSVTLDLAESTTYDFKVVKRVAGSDDVYYGKSGTTFTRSNLTSVKNLTDAGGDTYNMHITTDVAGTYTFTYIYDASTSNMRVLVKYPCATAGQQLFKFTRKSTPTSGNVCSSSSKDVAMTTDDALAILAGGTLTARAEGSNNRLVYVAGAFSFASGSYGVLRIDLDCPLNTGDKIRYINSSDDAAKNAYVRHTSQATTTNQLTLDGNKSSVTEIEVPSAFNNKSTIYIVTGGTLGAIIPSIEIFRPAACSTTAEAGANKATTVEVGVAMAATAATSGYTGAWSIKASSPSTDAGQLGTTSSNTMTFTPNQSGTYTLVWTVTDSSDPSCSATDEATVTVSRNTPTQYSVSGTATICSGGNTNITLSDSEEGASYQLKKGGVAEGVAKAGTGEALTWSVSAAGTYTVSAVQTTKYSARDMTGSAVVSIYDAVSIGTQPTAAVNAIVGQAASLSGLALASGTFNSAAYQWQTCNSDGSSASDITSGSAYANYTTATLSFTPGSAGTYYFKCKVTDGCSNTVSSNVVTVTAKNQPAQYTVSGNASICSGDDTDITLSDSEDGVTYKLYKGEVDQSDDKVGDGNELTWTVSAAGTYTVKAEESSTYWERAMSESATVSFKTATSISTQPATAVDATVNEDFTLGSALVAAGDGTLQYQWFSYSNAAGTDDETSVSSASTTKTFTTSKAATGTYYYRVKVIGGCGTVASNVIAVTVAACSPTTLADITVTGKNSATETVGTAEISLTNAVTENSGYKICENGDFMRVTIYSGNLQEGDKFAITITKASDLGDNKLHIYKYASSTWTELGSITAASAGTYTYTLTADNVATSFNTIGLYRTDKNQNPYVKSMVVTRPCAATTYSVTYADGGATDGDVPEDNNTYDEGDEVTVLGNTGSLEKTGYTFAGWNDGSTDYDADDTFTMPAEDVTLTAQWTEDTHTVSVASGAHGTVSPSSVSGVGIATASGNITATPSTGYSFNGWTLPSGVTAASTYTASSNPIKINATSDDLTITATWTTVSYTISYTLNGGDDLVSPKTSYNIETDDYDLPTPTKDGYVFQGWYTASDFSGDRVYTLAQGSTGNKNYYAKWADGLTINWTITKVSSKLYKGGTGYTVTAVVDDADWDASGSANDLVLSASDGVTLSNITKSINGDGKAQVVANFSVAGDVDGDKIYFTLSVPAAGDYSAIEDEKEVELDDCPGGSTSVTLTHFDTSNTNCKDDKPDSQTKYLYGYKSSTMTSANAYTITASATDNKGANSNVELILKYDSNVRIYADNATTSAATGFTGVTAVSFKWMFIASGSSGTASRTVSYTVKVGSTKVADAVSISGKTSDGYATINITGISNLDGYVEISTDGSSTSDNWYIDDISITYAGSGGVATSLAWSDDDATAGTVNKNDNDGDFQIYASPTPANAGGTITYSSSNTSVATVNSDGTVHIVNDGSTTITASMPAYGCYSAATSITYSLEVANTCDDTPGTIVDNDGNAIAGNKVSRGACETLTLKLTGYSGSAIQWKKDGVNIVGATSASYTIPAGNSYSGVYSATVTGTCTLASTNNITVTTAGSVDPTIFADEFTVKSGRPFHYRLMQLNKGESVSVKSATSWTENTDFVITKDADNIVYISSKTYAGVTIASAGTETITLTISNECGGSADKEITIHKIEATAKPTVAWIATSTDDTKGVKDCRADQSTSTTLYKYLETYYTMTARNCYWETREDSLVKEYSKYDLVILTDYPNSGTCPKGKSGKSNSYTNAIGQLIDYRPIMTFEAFVAGCPNWGIPTDPSNTKATQKSLTLLCNASDIFDDDTDKFAAGADIAVTTAASGQALQGFPVASLPDFVFIGKITDNDTKEYIACCERQVNTSARTLIFGLNSALMSNLTDDGKLMVKGFADYLLETDPASIPDCSVIFKGGGGDNSWYTTGNWEGGSLPNEYASVRIDKPCEVPSNASPAMAGNIKIHQGGAFTGSLTIKPAGCMIVEKAITRVEDNEYTVHKRTQPSDVVIEATSSGQGALIFNNESARTQATVQMYSKAHYDEQDLWQYVAVPLVSASRWNMGDWAFKYDNVSQDWSYYEETYYAFDGIGLTQDAADTYEFEGELASTTKKTIPLYPGDNLVGNSWTAPIHIVNFDEDKDFGSATATVFIYETGHDPEGGATNTTGDVADMTPGKWHSIPVAAARTAIDAGTWNGMTVIPAMQAFEVKTTSNTSLTLNYDQLVRDLPESADTNEPLHAPRRGKRINTNIPIMRVTMSDSTARNDVYLFSGEQFSEGFDNGWDGEFLTGESRYAQLYAMTPNGNLAISAQPEMDGTVLGFVAGTSEQYTMTFRYIGDETLYLNDMLTQTSTLIDDESEYMFTAQAGERNSRFVISSTPFEAPQTPTGVENVSTEAPKVRKLIINDKVYIIRNGRIYGVDGALVK